MSDEQDLEQRLRHYRPASPSPEFDGRLLSAIQGAHLRVSRFPALRGGRALAASLLIVACVGAWWWTSVGRRAVPAANSPKVVRLVMEDGTTLILSTEPDRELLPPGTAIILGGE